MGAITYQIWGRVQRLGPMEFGAIVTAMPDDDSAPQVETQTFDTQDEAYRHVEALALRMAEETRRSGAKVSRVLID